MQVRGFVGCHAMLEVGCYIVVCVAFNHWNTAIPADSYPDFVLAMHSSKKLVLEQVGVPEILLQGSGKSTTQLCPSTAELVLPPDGGRDNKPDPGQGDAARGARGHDCVLPDQGLGGTRRHDREQAPGQMGSGNSTLLQLQSQH